MKIFDIIYNESELTECEVVYCDKDGNELLDEAAIRQFKKVGDSVVKKFRCLSGPKAGKLVATPNSCGVRKDPKLVRRGRAVMRRKSGLIQRKSLITKKRAQSKQVARLNKRLSGN